MDDETLKKLGELAKQPGIKRKWSPEKTEECPVEDVLNGGFMESDAQLREKLKSEKCECCELKEGQEEHSCPLKSELHGDEETLCNCCRDCEWSCSQEI